MKNLKSVKVPIEFDDFIRDLQTDFKKQTGVHYSKSAVMRNMSRKLKGKIIARGNDFDYKIW